MATVLLTGGTGNIGTALTNALVNQGHHVIIVTRDRTKYRNTGGVSYVEWDLEKFTIDSVAIGSADHIINLAGAGVADKRWSDKRKKEIEQSRIKAGELLVKAINNIPNKITSVVNSSAIGWYGPDEKRPGREGFVETDPAYGDFLGNTCVKWEKSIEPVVSAGRRLVILRTGIVLGKDGGAFAEFVKPLQFGVASILGSGKQIVSWIHMDDLVSMYIYAMQNEKMNGVYNAVAPNPVSNKELILAIAKARGKFFIPVPVPSVALKILLGEMSIEVLKSATVSAQKILDAGFNFNFPDIDKAARDLVKP